MKILLVDDNPLVRKMMREFIPENAFVVECSEGDEAIARNIHDMKSIFGNCESWVVIGESYVEQFMVSSLLNTHSSIASIIK